MPLGGPQIVADERLRPGRYRTPGSTKANGRASYWVDLKIR
jgi:hypothetical protein